MLVAINDGEKIVFAETGNIVGVHPRSAGSVIKHCDGSEIWTPVDPENIAIMINEALVQEHVNKWQAIERARSY